MSLCSRYQSRISAALDEDVEIPQSIRKHIDGCRSCSEFLDGAKVLEERLTTAQLPSSSPWLHTKIMARVSESTPVDSSSRWLPAAIGLAAIGIAIVAITISTRLSDPELADSQPDTNLPAPVTPLHPATITRDIEQHAKLALGKEFRDIASDISGARNFFTASLRSTIPGLAGD